MLHNLNVATITQTEVWSNWNTGQFVIHDYEDQWIYLAIISQLCQ